eukprot:XP_008763129.1 PREDICTED: uncharacterized protein LOC103692699 isoform X2 [Rattus norvegicus]
MTCPGLGGRSQDLNAHECQHGRKITTSELGLSRALTCAGLQTSPALHILEREKPAQIPGPAHCSLDLLEPVPIQSLPRGSWEASVSPLMGPLPFWVLFLRGMKGQEVLHAGTRSSSGGTGQMLFYAHAMTGSSVGDLVTKVAVLGGTFKRLRSFGVRAPRRPGMLTPVIHQRRQHPCLTRASGLQLQQD